MNSSTHAVRLKRGDFVQKTIFIPEKLYLRVKAQAVLTQRDIGSILADAVREYLDKKGGLGA